MNDNDYDNWKLDNNEDDMCECDSCQELYINDEIYEHNHRLYCCGCLEKIKEEEGE